jgi:ATP-dependent Clp protease ATP-binding subunit ClpC
MALERLTPEAPPGAEHVLLAGGLGAAHILLPENGLHVEEHDDPGTRVTASVTVVARPPDTWQEHDHLRLARRLLAGHDPAPVIVRRYRARPSPLVRDGVRGYRTGRLDRVLAGDFDLF